MREDLLTPGGAVEVLQLFEFFLREIESLPVDVRIVRHPADGRFLGFAVAVGAIDDPFEYPHVFAEAGPEEFALGVLAEPVHVKDARRFAQVTLHADPVAEVVAHVVAAEG